MPESVWRFELGGYPILKKWLGYRQANRRNNFPLTIGKRRCFKSMVQRIAALLAMGSNLDKILTAASEDAYTICDLKIDR